MSMLHTSVFGMLVYFHFYSVRVTMQCFIENVTERLKLCDMYKKIYTTL